MEPSRSARSGTTSKTSTTSGDGRGLEADVGARRATEAVFSVDRAKILAVLIGDLGDYDLAEDGLQDAFAEALRSWPSRGVPDLTDRAGS